MLDLREAPALPHPTDVKPLDLAAVWGAEPPVLDFVLPGLAAGTVGMVVSAGGTGKTFAMMATALGIAIGRDVGGIWGDGLGQGRAVFLSLEDPEIALRSRLHAFLPGLSEDERRLACGSLDVLACAGHGLSFAAPGNKEPELSAWFKVLGDYLAKTRPRICVVDTLNRALGGISENDAGAMGWLIGEIEQTAREVGCAIVLCHHVSKQALTTASAGEAHAARGSSVITDNARWQCNLSTPGDKDKLFAGKSELERRGYVRLAFSKTNYGPPIAARWLRRGDDGVLGHQPVLEASLARARKAAVRGPLVRPPAAADRGPDPVADRAPVRGAAARLAAKKGVGLKSMGLHRA